MIFSRVGASERPSRPPRFARRAGGPLGGPNPHENRGLEVQIGARKDYKHTGRITPGLVLSVPSPFLVFRAPLGTSSPGQIQGKSIPPRPRRRRGRGGIDFRGICPGELVPRGARNTKKGLGTLSTRPFVFVLLCGADPGLSRSIFQAIFDDCPSMAAREVLGNGQALRGSAPRSKI